MTYLRYLLVGLIAWLLLLQAMDVSLRISSALYIILIACTLVLVLWPAAYRASPLVPFAVASLTLLFAQVLGILSGHQPFIGVQALPEFAVEIAAIAVTVILARALGLRIGNTQAMLADLIIGDLGRGADDFEAGQKLIYREIRRARQYQRPATLVAVSVSDASLERANRPAWTQALLQDVQREVLKKYVAARTSALLINELNDGAVVAQRGDHFVALLPETGREQAQAILDRVGAVADKQMGVRLNIGVSTFPDEAVTFETLLHRAESAMDGEQVQAAERPLFTLEALPNNGAPSLKTRESAGLAVAASVSSDG